MSVLCVVVFAGAAVVGVGANNLINSQSSEIAVAKDTNLNLQQQVSDLTGQLANTGGSSLVEKRIENWAQRPNVFSSGFPSNFNIPETLMATEATFVDQTFTNDTPFTMKVNLPNTFTVGENSGVLVEFGYDGEVLKTFTGFIWVEPADSLPENAIVHGTGNYYIRVLDLASSGAFVLPSMYFMLTDNSYSGFYDYVAVGESAFLPGAFVPLNADGPYWSGRCFFDLIFTIEVL